ncbi:hypothetical protein D3C71_2029880 [compost metagenome]
MLTVTLSPAHSDPRAGINRVLPIRAFHFLTVDLLVTHKVTRLVVKVDVGVDLDLLLRLVVLTLERVANVLRECRIGDLIQGDDL